MLDPIRRQRRSIVGVLRRSYDALLSVELLRKRGLVQPLRLGDSVRALYVARKAGPFAAMIAYGLRHAADAPAIVDQLGALSYRELETQSNALSHGLSALGLAPGATIGVLCRDHRGIVLTLIAAGKLGIRVVLLNTGFAKPQLADVAQRERVDALLLDEEFGPLAELVPDEIARVLTWVDDCARLDPTIPTLISLIAGGSTNAPRLPAKPGGLVLLTSGTTGMPKGALRERVSPLQSAQLLDRIPLTRHGALVIAAPLFHGTGLAQVVLAMTLEKKVVLRQLKFDAETLLAAVTAHHVDTLILVPTMLQRIVDLPHSTLSQYDTSSLNVIVCAGSALSPELCRSTLTTFGDVLYNIYGSTEVANASVATPAELRLAPGTVGRPPLGCRLAIYDEQRKLVTTANTPGTIFASNGLSFAGYTDGGRKELVDGMIATGDIGHFDDLGLLFVDGRDDEMIVSGGENVFPVEVENLLAERADVRDAAVIGVEDRDFGERLCAFIVSSADANQDAQEIKDYIRSNLARYKVPREIVFVEEIPRNAMGKLVRMQLKRPTRSDSAHRPPSRS